MNLRLTQANRTGRLTTDLGEDVLLLLRFSGTEYLNGLFEFTVEALSATHDVNFNALMGTHATVELETDHHGPRVFDGIVTSAAWSGVEDGGHRFTLTLRPWFWLAGFRRNQRIFHNRSAPQILGELVRRYSDLGAPAFASRLTRKYPPLEYTVQYQESDLDFARRLMERFGISFHFAHAKGTHTLVLTDIPEEHAPIAGGSRPYVGILGERHAEEEHFWSWSEQSNMTTGATRLIDYNFKDPNAGMEVAHLGDAEYPNGDMESFEYPGDYGTQSMGEHVARLRTSQSRGGDRRAHAIGRCLSLGAGMTMKLTGDQIPGVKDEGYLCLSATHSYSAQAYDTVGAAAPANDDPTYTGSYVLMPSSAPMAPPRGTAIPRVHGPLTAVVVGQDEIDCDEFGRILVKFHWDLAGANSMRCRVSQAWAGQGWGGMVIPRVGMEVIVEFIDGDPDYPIVTGCVYNGLNMPPYTLPDNRTRATLMSKTHGGEGFNELRFEDGKDKEEVFVHAQKDMNEKVRNNATRRVNVNLVESIGNNRGVEVHNNAFDVVGGDYSLNVGPGQRGRFSPSGCDTDTQGIGAEGEGLGKLGQGPQGEGNMELSIANNLSESIGNNHSEAIGRNKASTVGQDYYIDAGKQFVLDVGEKITIKCGLSVITLDKSGSVSINGKAIDLKGNSTVTVKSSAVKIN
ncbi:MAG: type VI secretion system tip protein VgrG [Rubellimicrobium sp.]|nr:type VI secretion system tip protein VgrG [Rubellimicrobium sp.]